MGFDGLMAGAWIPTVGPVLDAGPNGPADKPVRQAQGPELGAGRQPYKIEERPAGRTRALRFRIYSQPIGRPLFCSSSHFRSGLKYSTIARVESSSPVASLSTLRQSSVLPFSMIFRKKSPTSLLPA